MFGLVEWFTGSSDKIKNIEDHIVPIVQNGGRPLTHTDCFTWLNQKVVILLVKFDNPQIGTVKYIGSDDKGKLCAGIEFEYDVGGMNGKIHGQKLFKCRPGHGLLIPVEFVRLLVDYEDGRNIFPPASAPPSNSSPSTSSSQNVSSRTQALPNSDVAVPLEDYTPLTLPELKTGDNVVWLGGSTPLTGIVRWIGRAGKSVNLPIKVWVEMDDYVGFGLTEIDVGTKFGCASGRGKLYPADELILLENFLPQEVPLSQPETVAHAMPSSGIEDFLPPVPVVESINKPLLYPEVPSRVYTTIDNQHNRKPHPVPATEIIASSATERQPPGDNDLIDFSDNRKSPDLKITPEGNTVADLDFFRVMNEEPMDTDEACMDGLNSLTLETESSISATDWVFVPSAPPPSLPTDSPVEEKRLIATPEPMECSQTLRNEIDVNGNVPQTESNTTVVRQNGVVLSENVLRRLVDDSVEDYLPPFIIPPIDIVEFFKAEGLKGIQGSRNSCYIDVVIFSMFAFTDVFDPYFLAKSNLFNKVNDSQLTKTGKKVLAEQIVNPLRQSYYTKAAGINELRELMIPFCDKLNGAFLDIEEFMLIMFNNLFQLKEFLIYDNGVKDYLHQIHLGDHLGDHSLPPAITLKQCLDLSFKDYKFKLQKIPGPAFIIEIPRHHSGIIQSTVIVPNLTLHMDESLLNIMENGDNANNAPSTKSITMNLVAVICINNFHFVSFVKCGKGALSHWVLFDSNPSEERPKVEMLTRLGEHLESLEHQVLTNPNSVAENKHKLPPMVQQFLSDLYVCIYV